MLFGMAMSLRYRSLGGRFGRWSCCGFHPEVFDVVQYLNLGRNRFDALLATLLLDFECRTEIRASVAQKRKGSANLADRISRKRFECQGLWLDLLWASSLRRGLRGHFSIPGMGGAVDRHRSTISDYSPAFGAR